LFGIRGLGAVGGWFGVVKSCGGRGEFAEGEEVAEEAGAIGVEAGDAGGEEGGELRDVDGGFEGDAEAGGGVDGWGGGGLGLVDAVEVGGFDGLEAEECPFGMGELL
jgi:hypothetical protein